MRTAFRSLSLTLAAIVLTACGSSGVPAGAAATVNGETIDRGLLERIVAAQLEAQPPGDDEDVAAEQEADVQRNILSALIGFEIVAQMADELGIEVDDETIASTYDEQVELTGGEDAFGEFLDSIGLTPDEYRDIIVADLTRRDALEAQFGEEVTDDDIRAMYDERRESQFVTRTTRHILVQTAEEADDIFAELEDGADFAELATEHSEDPGSGAQGGDLGPQPRGTFVPEFDEAVWSADVGDLLEPVESDFGFHVIEVLDETDVSFEEAEPQLRAELEQMSAQSPELLAAYEQAFADADVQIGAGLGAWDADVGQVVAPGTVGEDTPDEGLPGEVPDEDAEIQPEEPVEE